MTENRAASTARDRELQRRFWLSVYFPVILGGVFVVALVVVMAVLGFQQQNLGGDPVSAVGDAAAILVVIQALVLLLIPLVILVGLCAAFFWLHDQVQPVLRQGQALTSKVSQKTGHLAETLAAAVARPYLLGARLDAVRHFLRR
ncbi:MAG: hypothetical protein KKC18_16420 [Chloroflexi bacterium]|nr:hypothetical protein [Chloroflexota bacterium]